MRRAGHLFERIADPENLRLAFWKARRCKDGKPEVEAFRSQMEAEVMRLSADLLSLTVAVGDYHTFTIHDPKERLICAASFRERVLHHAIINVCEPVFERFLIHDSYACRKGKGLHVCLERAKRHTRRHDWYLKLDVRKYFDSIPHAVLKANLRRRFKDGRLLALFDRLIDSYAVTPGRGIPIGNLTSQHFANDYLAGLDHWIMETLRVPGYIRYMDDMILWHDDRRELAEIGRQIRAFCQERLALELKPPCLNRTAAGVTMLGYRVFPNSVRLAARSRKRFSRNLAIYWRKLEDAEWGQDDFSAHVLPLAAYAGHADSTGFRLAVMEKIGCSPQARTA